MNQIKLCYMDSKFGSTVKPLTAQLFKSLTECQLTKDLMERINQAPDEDAKNHLKNKLMVAIYGCQMPEDGIRPTKEIARPSGLCLHDFDHMQQDVRTFYQQHLAGREEELGIYLAHISPRGKGLRLVTRLQDGERYVQCQERMAAMLGLPADASVKDITHLSFIPSANHILYLNEDMFTLEAPAEEIAAEKDVVAENATATPEASRTTVEGAQELPTGTLADNLEYENGVKYSQIIRELLSRLATNGTPTPGERNMDLYALVRELRHCTKYNFELTRQLVTPYFSELPDQEIRRTINSAINSAGRVMTPSMKAILTQLKAEKTPIAEDLDSQYPKMPKVAPVVEKVLHELYKKNIHRQVVLAMLPIFGTYGTHIRFRYLNNRVNSLSFMTAVVGKTSRGKAFGEHLYSFMTEIIRQWDEVERQKANEYQRKCNQRKEGEDFPEDPHPKIRNFSDDITTCMMLEYLDNLNDEHGLQFTEEVATLVKARKSRFSDNDDLYCKAYDNGEAGKESKNAQTRNIKRKIFLNFLFCGTNNRMHEMFNNAEGGLNNRVIFALMPEIRTKGIPRYEDPSPELKQMMDDALMDLWKAGTLEEEQGEVIEDPQKVHQGKQEFKFAFLDKAIGKWIDECDKEDDENPDETWRMLANRAACTGYRAGVLMWFLWGRPTDKKTLKHVQEFAIWVAKCARIGAYNFCGDEYDRLNEASFNQPKVRQSKCKKLFSNLADDFTVQDVIDLRRQNGDSENVAMILSRWGTDGLIMKTGDKTYRKVKQIA